ncbi:MULTISPECIES: UDP-2,4-diacetamido-2,4,6-trideoxy-beta-L-altropyranose hydrolase [unclassified Sphingomonas]|uniref:UDP-2,4-diacetamido-2,4, 6-trideoxy-beta-L-altropyranose hydrolase n=1 Tax=Sphingomonas TaxID=13687 RepID=UPI001ACA4169|nr:MULTISPECIES: UDP-2,4-diacetamido-2,4,6-trideoxy-beta-L-altropyranose hydrolase [unclassified Sphingomonas]MBN8811836.1 UDP-2,4-diacetamido-2,4,6-trideoxy-beta-L-altropyranose hydrolase [Sphingomonas sp.]
MIRTDASRAIGTGHVRRSLALAHALRELGAEVRFVTRDLGADAGSIIGQAGFPVLQLPARNEPVPPSAVPHAAWAEVSIERDVMDTAEVLRAERPDWVVLDHYAFDAVWHNAIRAELGSRIAVIDDLADRMLSADLIVDHNFAPDHRVKYEGRAARESILLGGPRYALLGPAFAQAERYASQDPPASIGVFLGGVDSDNASAVVLNAIDRAGFKGPVEIVSTSVNPNLTALQTVAAARPGTSVRTDLPDLTGFFARHSLQVGAGGGATWERCCIGAPTVLLVLAENQLAVVPALVAENIVVSPEPLGTRDVDAVAAAIRALLDDATRRSVMSERARALVDGHGARRVALRMLAEGVTVRAAVRDDAERMYRWRNHPATRLVSRNVGEITWSNHLAWLDRVLDDPGKKLMIGMVGTLPIGVIRFDRLDTSRAEVSLYLDPMLHGLGLGSNMLRAAEAVVDDDLDILAEVAEGNGGSARMFESAEYARIDVTRWIKPAKGRVQAKRAG